MGCGGSKITVVEPVKPSSLNGNEFAVAQGGSRGESAVSKMTTDSGVSLDAREPVVLPGSVPGLLPPLRAQSPVLAQRGEERPESSEILEQLLTQGIIPAHPKQGGSGQAYNIMMDEAGKPRSKPPARLESLKTLKEQEVTRKEDIEMKMRQVEERRKEREEDLKRRMRIRSARPRVAAHVTADLDPTEQLPVPSRTERPECEERRPPASPELEHDSSFQQAEDRDQAF
ncbi:stathmin domain-containing protein 1 [Rhinichthys klamathensis goyatoka]|uniref:stathmin domain-containing protein 1 n=1 Tax=Rhinichthys klamathensis goyatoka TaxID=3034132 RepID=UPI0024B50D40|nr:stathmin domain-containing protein 1 [Rhinichthys klamathensis goyatoka]